MAKKKDEIAGVPIDQVAADVAATASALYAQLSPESMASLHAAINAGVGNGVLIGSEIIPIPPVEPVADSSGVVVAEPPIEVVFGGAMSALVLGERVVAFREGRFSTSEPALIGALDAYIATGATDLWREG